MSAASGNCRSPIWRQFHNNRHEKKKESSVEGGCGMLGWMVERYLDMKTVCLDVKRSAETISSKLLVDVKKNINNN